MPNKSQAHQVRSSKVAETAPEPAAKQESKTDKVIALLKRPGGATLEELVAATGWQSHTTRAALTGLRKKGHAIERTRRNETTCYSIVQSA